ncbi:MAG: ATP-binding cassette domain-containing protein [bacterium]|nr:ATP-binding cassette domain-containing protein [bacterium]
MIEAVALTKTYPAKGPHGPENGVVRALAGVDLCVEPGDLVAVHGPSGSGKSTLLLMLGGMLHPTSGNVRFRGDDIYAIPRHRRNSYRKFSVGFIFQKFYLLPYLTVYDNIRLPLALQAGTDNHREAVLKIAGRLGIESRLGHKPAELSAGEQQRVALARTLVAEPDLVLADEPTGNLDEGNTEVIAECLVEESAQGRAIVLATHDTPLMRRCTRSLRLEAGAAVD